MTTWVEHVSHYARPLKRPERAIDWSYLSPVSITDIIASKAGDWTISERYNTMPWNEMSKPFLRLRTNWDFVEVDSLSIWTCCHFNSCRSTYCRILGQFSVCSLVSHSPINTARTTDWRHQANNGSSLKGRNEKGPAEKQEMVAGGSEQCCRFCTPILFFGDLGQSSRWGPHSYKLNYEESPSHQIQPNSTSPFCMLSTVSLTELGIHR